MCLYAKSIKYISFVCKCMSVLEFVCVCAYAWHMKYSYAFKGCKSPQFSSADYTVLLHRIDLVITNW